jgi:hypothetical protein
VNSDIMEQQENCWLQPVFLLGFMTLLLLFYLDDTIFKCLLTQTNMSNMTRHT